MYLYSSVPVCKQGDTKNINKDFKINIKMWLYLLLMKEITKKKKEEEKKRSSAMQIFSRAEYCLGRQTDLFPPHTRLSHVNIIQNIMNSPYPSFEGLWDTSLS